MVLLGLDLGATSAKAAVVRGNGVVAASASRALGDGAIDLEASEVVALLADAADAAVRASGAAWADVTAVGLGSPGAVDGFEGTVSGCANLFRDATVPLRRLTLEALSKFDGFLADVALLNDGDAALCAEVWVGAAKGCDHVAMLTLGSGVGCGLLVGGKTVRRLVEGGHMIVAGPEGRPCGCGSRGCLEAYASANAVSKMYSEETGAEATCAAVFAKALEGESAAMRVVDVSARHLALGCINLLRILDPQVVVLGGGMAAAGEALLAAVRRHVEELGWNCLPKCADRIRLVGAGPHAGCIGAAKAALDAAGSDVPPAPTHPPSPPVS